MIESHVVFNKKFTANRQIKAMALGGGNLYVAVGGTAVDDQGIKIFRLKDAGCELWDDVTRNWGGNVGPCALAFYKNELFIGTSFVGATTGLIYRLAYNEITKPPPYQVVGSVESMVVFNDQLYAGCGSLYRTADGFNWQDLGTIREFGEYEGTDKITLAAHDGHIYAGFGILEFDPKNAMSKKWGIEIWRSADGQTWEPIKVLKGSPIEDAPQHVHTMVSFNGHLYIGGYEGPLGTVYRTIGSAGDWEQYQAMQFGNIGTLAVHDGKLYSGMYIHGPGVISGESILYVTLDGTEWKRAPGSPIANDKMSGATALISFNGKLYLGTRDLNGGQIFEVGDPLSLCRLDVAFARIAESLKNLRDIVERLQKHDDTLALMDIDIYNLIAFDVEEWLGNKWVPPIPRDTIAQKLAADYMRVVRRELQCVDQFLREMWVSNDSRERAVRRERAVTHAKRARDTYQLFCTTLDEFKGERAF